MNIYITGHGYMSNETLSTVINANFYVHEDESLDDRIIPNIAGGNTQIIDTQTWHEHYIFATKVESLFEPNGTYWIDSFDTQIGTLEFISPNTQSFKEFRNAHGDAIIFPYTEDDLDMNIDSISSVVQRGNTLTAIIDHYQIKYQNPVFHWCSCRGIVYPSAI